MLEPAHIVGVSKTAYVRATPRCLEWRRDLRRTGTNSCAANATAPAASEEPVRPAPPPRAAQRGTRPAPRRHGVRGSPPAAQQGPQLSVDGWVAAARTGGVRARQRPAGGEPAPAAGPDRQPG